MNKQNINIPSDADFERAKKRQAEMSQEFVRIRETVLREFKGGAPVHEIWLFPDRVASFRAYVFYRSNSDIPFCKENGTEKALKEALAREFAIWKGSSCEVEFDSHENVLKKCNGNYHKYFR